MAMVEEEGNCATHSRFQKKEKKNPPPTAVNPGVPPFLVAARATATYCYYCYCFNSTRYRLLRRQRQHHCPIELLVRKPHSEDGGKKARRRHFPILLSPARLSFSFSLSVSLSRLFLEFPEDEGRRKLKTPPPKPKPTPPPLARLLLPSRLDPAAAAQQRRPF